VEAAIQVVVVVVVVVAVVVEVVIEVVVAPQPVAQNIVTVDRIGLYKQSFPMMTYEKIPYQ
jgi:hypothetical protein